MLFDTPGRSACTSSASPSGNSKTTRIPTRVGPVATRRRLGAGHAARFHLALAAAAAEEAAGSSVLLLPRMRRGKGKHDDAVGELIMHCVFVSIETRRGPRFAYADDVLCDAARRRLAFCKRLSGPRHCPGTSRGPGRARSKTFSIVFIALTSQPLRSVKRVEHIPHVFDSAGLADWSATRAEHALSRQRRPTRRCGAMSSL